VPEKRNEGRIISQALSFKLVFGVGLGLVIGAILPFVFGKASRRSQPVNELPAWSNNGGSTGTNDSNSQTTAPAWPSSPAAHASPQTPPNILSPQRPQVGDNRPVAPAEPAWPPSRPPVTPALAITPSAANHYINPLAANTNPPANRGFDRPADPRSLQADNRNDPAAPYRNSDPRYDYRPNSIDNTIRRDVPAVENAVRHDVSTIENTIRRDVPAGGYPPRDTRYDNVNGPYPPAVGPGSPLMPSAAPGPAANYRDPQTSEPGVARFDGTIAPPPVR
jgi:hypothetical protein